MVVVAGHKQHDAFAAVQRYAAKAKLLQTFDFVVDVAGKGFNLQGLGFRFVGHRGNDAAADHGFKFFNHFLRLPTV